MTPSETPLFTQTGSISDELDRLEVLTGKIGMNTPAQALELLTRLDKVHAQIGDLDVESASWKVTDTQLNGILARLKAESAQFIRDIGGPQALQQAREEVQPLREQAWWFIDEYLVDKQRSRLRRLLIYGGIAAAVIVILAVVYQAFLKPDPQVAALYRQEMKTRDHMQSGDLEQALEAVETGLKVDPNEPTLLTFRGIILENQGRVDQAALDFTAAGKGFSSREAFYITRGQGYAMINQLDKALADANAALEADSRSARAYLLIGQVHETQGLFQEAIHDYDKAFEIAEQNDQIELAAIARTRTAMLMQMMSMPQSATQTPVP